MPLLQLLCCSSPVSLLTSIPARFVKQLRSVLLTMSHCQFVCSFPSHLPHLSVTHPNLSTSNFCRSIGSWHRLNSKHGFPSFAETTTNSRRTNCCTVSNQTAHDAAGRDSPVGIATRYGLSGPGIEFRTRPDLPWGPPSLLYNGYRVFTGAKAVWAWR